jgi:hypothetical protein
MDDVACTAALDLIYVRLIVFFNLLIVADTGTGMHAVKHKKLALSADRHLSFVFLSN